MQTKWGAMIAAPKCFSCLGFFFFTLILQKETSLWKKASIFLVKTFASIFSWKQKYFHPEALLHYLMRSQLYCLRFLHTATGWVTTSHDMLPQGTLHKYHLSSVEKVKLRCILEDWQGKWLADSNFNETMVWFLQTQLQHLCFWTKYFAFHFSLKKKFHEQILQPTFPQPSDQFKKQRYYRNSFLWWHTKQYTALLIFKCQFPFLTCAVTQSVLCKISLFFVIK